MKVPIGVLMTTLILSLAWTDDARAFSWMEARYQAENHPYHQCGRATANGWASAPAETACFVVYGPYTREFQNPGTGSLLALFSLAGDSGARVTVDVVDITRNKVFTSQTIRGLSSDWEIFPVVVRDFDGAGELELRVYKDSGTVRVNWTQASYLHKRAQVKTRRGNEGTTLVHTNLLTGDIYLKTLAGKPRKTPCLRLVERINSFNHDVFPGGVGADPNAKGRYCSTDVAHVRVTRFGVDYRLRALDLSPQGNTIFLFVTDLRPTIGPGEFMELLDRLETIRDIGALVQALGAAGV